ncbi:MAG: nitronate monooxygenase [Proteobacteria bacterium]|nr:nitronate monooxygenase [Pseudomonadota bacterium]
MDLASLLGVEFPVIQAPMAGVQGSALAIAVARAGGLGSLPAALLSAEALRTELAAFRAATHQPLNVNFFCHKPPVFDASREARWRRLLEPYYAECGLDSTQQTPAPLRLPFDAASATVLEEFSPEVVSFHFGLPSPELLARVQATGAKILASATTPDEARWLEARGVDAVIAQGAEAGGHRGIFLDTALDTPQGTSTLLPRIARAVRVPVIAAGGIGEAAAVAEAMRLGAAGIQAGTAYLLCPEATTSAVHRHALEQDGDRHTQITNLFSGRPARGIVNRLMRELGPMNAAVPDFPLAAAALAPLRAHAERLGRGDFSPLWAGENLRQCRSVPAGEVTQELARALRDS